MRRDSEQLSGWGGISVPGREILSEDLSSAAAGQPLTRGLGRAYGDAALPPPKVGSVAGSRLADRILALDPESGALRAEAGLSLREMVTMLLPRGWFVPVTPGTQFVTLGGMVAADVHGKNHHVSGTIGRHVNSLTLRLAGGEIVRCSREGRSDLFRATLGGMGLTGHILEVGLTLEKIETPWIYGESERFGDLSELLAALEAASGEWPFTAVWADLMAPARRLGRGILFRGRWARSAEAPAAAPRPKRVFEVPVTAPNWLLASPLVRGFNLATYRKHVPRRKSGIIHPEAFFYPLDSVGHWNRLYGKRGFTQYQCVLPAEAGREGAKEFLAELKRLGGRCFLAVIKDCGAEGEGVLSFPRPGISLALDLPVDRHTQELVDRLNERLLHYGGRIYLAKDAFTRESHFRKMEPRLERFTEIRRKFDPEARLRSALSVRLFGDAA